MKKLLILIVLAATGVWAYLHFSDSTPKPKQDSVHIGASIEEVERVLGPAERTLPNFGRELRFYKGESGADYMLTFENGELVDIQH